MKWPASAKDQGRNRRRTRQRKKLRRARSHGIRQYGRLEILQRLEEEIGVMALTK